MPSSPDIANDAAATFAAYPELVTKIDAGTTVPDAELDQWIGATYPNFIDACVTQVNEVLTGQRAAGGPLRLAGAPASGWSANADDVRIGTGSGDAGISLYQSTASGASGVWWRTSRSDSETVVSYSASSRALLLSAARDITLDAGAVVCGMTESVRPVLSGSVTHLGTDSIRWSDLFLKGQAYIAPAAAPATPSSGAVLYVDSGTGDPVVKFSTGTTTVLASP